VLSASDPLMMADSHTWFVRALCSLCAQFKVMVVGGPNLRRDYHIQDGEVSA